MNTLASRHKPCWGECICICNLLLQIGERPCYQFDLYEKEIKETVIT